jgi:multisubunit Na+/H+ antiporter MnhE subunit
MGVRIFKRMAPFAALWAALFVLWLAFVDTFDGVEMAAGAAASLLGAVAAEVVRRRRLLAYGLSLRAFGRSGGIAISILTDSMKILRALIADVTGRKNIRGAFRAVPFDTGSDTREDEPARAAATFKLSIAPNTYVVDMDTEEKILLVHQLVPDPKDQVKRRLERSL